MAQKRAIEDHYKNFTLNGALLNDEQKKELSDINTKLSNLYLKFNKNLLNATNAFTITVDDKARLSGLPDNVIATAKEEAEKRGLKDKWVFTLHAPSRLPVLQFADDRDLRRQMWEGYTSLASEGENDNNPVIKKSFLCAPKRRNSSDSPTMHHSPPPHIWPKHQLPPKSCC